MVTVKMKPEQKEHRYVASRDHKVLSIRKAEGKFISYAYNASHGWLAQKVNALTPGSHLLFNFDLPLVGDKLLVLDPYGDEILSKRVRKNLNIKYGTQTIGILHKTGEIVQVGFIEEYVKSLAKPKIEKKRYSVVYWSFGDTCSAPKMFLPRVWLKRIGELKSAKRPFHLTLPEHTVFSFIDRWASYADLQANIVVVLQFKDAYVHVWGENYRESTAWQDVKEP